MADAHGAADNFPVFRNPYSFRNAFVHGLDADSRRKVLQGHHPKPM
jgi:hypothetical protein